MMIFDETYEKRIELQATRINELEGDVKEAMDAGYAQGVLATEGKAIARITELEASLKESDRRLTTHYESATEYRMLWLGADAVTRNWEASYHSEHHLMLREERRAIKADAEVEKLKIQRAETSVQHAKDAITLLSVPADLASKLEKAEAQVEKFHQGFILQQAEAEKLAAELKEQTRLGLACHDELAELKAKYQESEDGSEMVDAENDPTNHRKGSNES